MEEHNNLGLPGAPEVGVINGHEYVDLGLSVLWATCNIGASSQFDYGNYFAWGETEPKDAYTEANYTAAEKTRLEPVDDPARVHWGGRWRLPTRSELLELIHKCDWVVYWRRGERPFCRVTSKTNGNSIIIPRGGYWDEQGPHEGEIKGNLWINTCLKKGEREASCLSLDYCHMWECDMIECQSLARHLGVPVRPVAKPEEVIECSSDRPLLESMPKLLRIALDKWGIKADVLLGYRMVIQRKGPRDTNSLLEDEIRLVDGSVFSRSFEGDFEHAFIQLCLPMVHYKYKTVELSSFETTYYTEGVDRTCYWTDRLIDVPGGEKEAHVYLVWLREWINSHRNAKRIIEPEIVVKDLRRKGRRVPVKMHICYADIPDPNNHGWCTRELARGHQDMEAWNSEEGLERMKPHYLLQGEVCGYGNEVSILAKKRLDESLGIDCEWIKIIISWADGEYERITKGMRFLMKKDVALLKRRLESRGTGIAPQALYKGLDNVYVRRVTWHREPPYPSGRFVEYALLSEPFTESELFNEEDEGWEVYSNAIPLNGITVEEIAKMLGFNSENS